MSLQLPHSHLTIDDYYKLSGDWELLGGTAFNMTPSPFGKHQQVARRLIVLLSNAIDAQELPLEVLHELDWLVSTDTVVRPDVIVVRGPVPSKHLTQAPEFIAEITSESTLQRDRTEKLSLYETNRVKHYLIVDLESKSIELHVLNKDGKYVFSTHTENLQLDFSEGSIEIRIDRLLV